MQSFRNNRVARNWPLLETYGELHVLNECEYIVWLDECASLHSRCRHLLAFKLPPMSALYWPRCVQRRRAAFRRWPTRRRRVRRTRSARRRSRSARWRKAASCTAAFAAAGWSTARANARATSAAGIAAPSATPLLCVPYCTALLFYSVLSTRLFSKLALYSYETL